jgi:membrane carboxypeptidase/penicillin-binding protein
MAARSYFGKPASSLSVAESALLASLVKGPTFYNPDRHQARSNERVAYVLRRLHEDGVISADELKEALAQPPRLVAYEGLPHGSHFADHLARESKTVSRAEIFAADAYTIRSTIHPALQRAAEIALQEGLSAYERKAGRWQFEAAEANLSDAIARIPSEENEDAKPAWQQALAQARLPLYDVHWPVAVVVDVPSTRAGTHRVGLVDGRVVPLSTGRAAGKTPLNLHDVIFVHLIESKGRVVRAELRTRPVVQGTAIVLENRTGRILAMVGGFSYPLSQLNRATQSQRQPGSALKPLVYLAALQHLQPNTLVRDDTITYPPIGGSKNARPEDHWTPKNYDGRDGGILTLRQALEASRNLPVARLLDGIDATPPQSLDRICKLALDVRLYKDCMRYYPFVLGAQPVRPIDLAAFYATIANEGQRPTPYAIEAVERNGESVYRRENATEEVASADRVSFYQLKSMLQGVLQRGTARNIAHLAPYVAGKTGTTDGENDAWFVGFSNDVTVAVWVGYDNSDGHRRTLGSGRTGGNVAIPIFEPIIQAVWSHHAPKAVLSPPSPDARRHLITARAERDSQQTRASRTATEYLRKDANGRAIDTQYRLVSRSDSDAFAAGPPTRRTPLLDSTSGANPWGNNRGWAGWPSAREEDMGARLLEGRERLW